VVGIIYSINFEEQKTCAQHSEKDGGAIPPSWTAASGTAPWPWNWLHYSPFITVKVGQ